MTGPLEPDVLERLSRLDGASPAAVVEELDADLAAAVRRTAVMRRLFYAQVLTVALFGMATGVADDFALPWAVAGGGALALELGAMVFLSNADTRRRLGEQALLSRLLGGGIAATAATYNVLTHDRLPIGVFFALMSVLGAVTWWLDAENKRRDRLRAQGRLAAPTPDYELWGDWLRHPVLTSRARALAKAYPQLGLTGSREAALIVTHRHQRNTALASELGRRFRRAAGRRLARIAVLTFDLEQVAPRLRAGADYDGLTAVLLGELTPDRLLRGRDDPAAPAARGWLASRRRRAPAHTTGQEHHTASGDGPPGTPQTAGAPDGPRPAPAPPAGGPWRAAAWDATARDAGPDGDTRPGQPAGIVLRAAARIGHDVIGPAPATGRGAEVTPLDPPARAVEAGRRGPAPAMTPRPAGAPAAGPPAGRTPVQVRVLGSPAVLDPTGTPLPALGAKKSRELLVFLAVQRDGATLAEILAALWPGAPARRAERRLSTCLDYLRNVIRTAAARGDDPDAGTRLEPIVVAGGRYRLAPDVVAVDWWRLLDEHPSTVDDPAAARDTVSVAAPALAEGCRYPWLRPGHQLSRRGGVRMPPDPRTPSFGGLP